MNDNLLNLGIEKRIFSQGYNIIGAIDEAGRGPLAGPVVAACAIIKPDFEINNEKLGLVKDSKKLTEKKREELFDIINNEFFEVGVGISDHDTIDRVNILQATFLAMKKAIGALKNKPDYLILDGKFPIPNITTGQKPIIKGDNSVFSIAAASIIAKVTRDRIMKEMNEKFPAYCFDKHKGYGTKLHMELLKKHGPCIIHRKSFAPVKRLLSKVK